MESQGTNGSYGDTFFLLSHVWRAAAGWLFLGVPWPWLESPAWIVTSVTINHGRYHFGAGAGGAI